MVALTLAGCAVASSLAMLVGSLSRTLAQQGAIGSGIYLVLALLGGNFTGTVTLGGVAGVMRRMTPNGWLLEGWDAALRGGDVGSIGLQIAVVLAFSVVFFVASLLVLRRRFA
jgi:ABC-2 type transport system permease protein